MSASLFCRWIISLDDDDDDYNATLLVNLNHVPRKTFIEQYCVATRNAVNIGNMQWSCKISMRFRTVRSRLLLLLLLVMIFL